VTKKTPYPCVIVDDDPVARAVLVQFISDVSGLELTACHESATEAMMEGALSSSSILFLDVEMPKMTGLELLETMSDPPLVVLVTSKTEYAVDAFGFDVVDYLVKPVTFRRFVQAVDRCRSIFDSRIDPGESPDHVFVKSEGRLVKLILKEIQWIEAQRDYVLIHTPKKDYFIHSTMKRLSERLGAMDFVRVHRSFIVRMDQIADIEDGSIRIGGKIIPVGASYEDALMKRLTML
jgi:DNA-binding LytR/AlgR family response regulator